ncbi:uncharacterized protein [Epargyreus clarus]|uniref:uncharacterized protein isoform X2 n=1 Tax=Epargyreus clarus TaxID=520877 RepID=UPI003C2AF549
MTTLIDKIEKLIKREKTTPDRKNDDSTKSSSEILSELFSAFNADPPKIEDIPVKKPKKTKKKHKKEKKKRSRSASSCSNSDLSEHSRRHKKRKKSKSKKHKDEDRTPTRRHSKGKSDQNHKLDIQTKDEFVKLESDAKSVDLNSVNSIKATFKDEFNKVPVSISSKEPNNGTVPFNTIDASLIPMPESPISMKLEPDKSKPKTETKEADVDKSKGKIQIKNLKFSAVFEETVKKAEEEARKKAEKEEDGECTASSSGSEEEEELNSQFPKSSDPGGILKKQADDEIKASEEEKISSSKEKQTDNSQKSKGERSSSQKRSRSKSKRSRSRSSSRRSVSKRHRYRSRSRSRRRSRSRHRSSSKSRHSKSRPRIKSRSRSRHRSPRPWRRRSRSPTGVKLADSEKKRLLEVARRNAINMLKNGAVPAGAAALPPHTRNQVMAAIQSGGKSVDELTDFCKHLSKKEALGELSSVSSNDEDMSDNEDTIAFHHPFLVKEKAPIIMNIRGGAPLPTKVSTLPIANKEELRLQFPVSSGTQHREKASEWVPVSPKKDDNMQLAKLNSKPAPSPVPPPALTAPKIPLALPEPPKNTPVYMKGFTSGSELHTVPALPAPGPQALPPNMESRIDVASIVSQKLSLIRKEQEQNEICETRGFGWAKTALGQFTGSTGANILTPRELASGTQAWAKKLVCDEGTRALRYVMVDR